MDTQYDHIEKQCKAYLADFPPEEADFTVSVTPEALEKELRDSRETGVNASRGYAESICLYRELCLRLPRRDALLLHAAVISDGVSAYAFTAPSGTGKSTHIRLWHEAFGDEIFVVNGDKPILRLIDGVWWAYGTPWCGKEGWHRNTAVPLKGLCFLSRGEVNTITRLQPIQAVMPLMKQILLPDDPVRVQETMGLLDHLTAHVPLYSMACNVSEEAARMARAAMTSKI